MEVTKLSKRLGEILVEHGKLDFANLERALRLQEGDANERIGALLVRAGFAAERDVTDALADQLGLSVVALTEYPELPVLEERVSARFIKESRALPIQETDNQLVLAMADPLDEYVLAAFRMVTQRTVTPRLAVPSELEVAFERLYGSGKTSMDQIVGEVETRDGEQENEDLAQLKELASEAPIIRLVSLIISHALEARASDIHIEPFESRLIVRYRVDGVMHEVESPPRRFSAAVISRIKIMASLDIAERRLPQDGRIKLRLQGREIDLRVSTVPTMHGESVVMRILDKSGTTLDFATLGFDDAALERFQQVLMQPHGILLVTGPTGSGKTVSLYTCLNLLNKPGVNIATADDTSEINLPGVNQVNVNEKAGLTFAVALKSFLRQDPDIIMVGEIRDLETAQIAVEASLTGHLVLSTLHTNSAPETITRLLDMDLEPFLITSSLEGILAQRLVRVLCRHCKEMYKPDEDEVNLLGIPQSWRRDPKFKLYRPNGCPACDYTGYSGRVGLFEMMEVDEPVRDMILGRAMSHELRKYARSKGMRTLREEGLIKCVQGITSAEEVLLHTDRYDD